MKKATRIAAVTYICVLIFLLSYSQSCDIAHGQTDPTFLRIQTAQDSANQAFNAVLSAERAGANVSELIAQTNKMDEFVANATNSYRTGDFQTAAALAHSVTLIAESIITSAQTDKQAALASEKTDFVDSVEFSLASGVSLIVLLSLIWIWIKKNHVKELCEARIHHDDS